MNITLRVLLIACSVFAFFLCVRKIKKSELKIENSIIWLIGSILLVLMSVFSESITWISRKLGFESTVNFVWMCAIGFLIIELFLYDIRITMLNEKIKNLNQYIAIEKNKEEKEKK